MIAISIVQCLLYLLVIPFCIGLSFTKHFDEKHNTIGNILTCGFISELAVFQVLFLLFYKLDKNLVDLTWASSIILFVIASLSLILSFKTIKKITLPKFDLGFLVFALFGVYMVAMRNLQGVNDGDDAFVIGNALTTLTTNSFYKIDYYTGKLISSESYSRHMLASNSIYIAYLAKVTFIHPTILAHRILGSFILILHNAVIYNISILLFDDKKEKYRSIFASFVSLMTIWDFHSYLTDSTFILSRAWQGKAQFVALSIPLSIMLLLMIGENIGKKKIHYALIFVLCFASVAMTPAAIVLLTLILSAGSICVSLGVKKFGIVLKMIPALCPMVIFAAIFYLFLK